MWGRKTILESYNVPETSDCGTDYLKDEGGATVFNMGVNGRFATCSRVKGDLNLMICILIGL